MSTGAVSDVAHLPAASADVLAPPARVTAGGARSRLLTAGLTVIGILVLCAIWEAYKALGPADGVRWGGTALLPRTDDLSMPHLWTIVARLGRPVNSVLGGGLLGTAVASASLVSLGIAGCGWVLGSIVGLALALLMQRFALAERAILPWVVLSQTVPLVALAPLVVAWGSQLQLPGLDWTPWMSVAVIAAYLAFFPLSVGALRGLKSPEGIHTDLFRSFGSGWWSTLVFLRLPASVGFLVPALRLGAASAVIGSIVAEVSTGTRGGIGRTVLEYAQTAGGDPAKPWASILGAIAVGLVAAGIVALLGATLRRYRRSESAS